MSVAMKKSEVAEIALEDMANKIKLEIPFVKDNRRFLRNVNDEFYNEYVAKNTIIDANNYKNELIAILIYNYNKISPIFKNNIRESFKDKTSKEIDAIINMNISQQYKQYSKIKSDYILSSTNREIALQMAIATRELIENEEKVNKENIAIQTKKRLDNNVAGRALGIAVTETQFASETAKDVESKILYNNEVVLDKVNISKDIKDIWATVGDSHVRPSHVRANGQIKTSHEKFIVGGEYLRYPGDPLGSIENIIHCRCSKVTMRF